MKTGLKSLVAARSRAKKISLVAFDFDGVFTDNKVIVNQNGGESVTCSRADGYGLQMLRDAGIDMLVLSSEVNPVVSARCSKLKIRCLQACPDKPKEITRQSAIAGIGLDEVAFLGNDINDVACMEIVGLPAAVADAFPEALSRAVYVTKKRGGDGAVREFCEFLVRAKGRK